MEFFEVVAKRYSHKAAFDPTHVVPEGHLRQIVEAGMAAPSAGNGQSTEFIIVTDRALIEQIGEVAQSVPLKTAPALVAIVSNYLSWGPSSTIYIEDYAATTENVILAATALGYCCGWVDGPFKQTAIREPASELLQVPDDRMLMVIVPVGYAGEPSARRTKKPFEERASWNRYAVRR